MLAKSTVHMRHMTACWALIILQYLTETVRFTLRQLGTYVCPRTMGWNWSVLALEWSNVRAINGRSADHYAHGTVTNST